jgi:hypothetical protein
MSLLEKLSSIPTLVFIFTDVQNEKARKISYMDSKRIFLNWDIFISRSRKGKGP